MKNSKLKKFAGAFNEAAQTFSTLDIPGTGGNDTLNGTGSADTISGGEGNDLIFALGGNDLLQGDAGDDELSGGAGRDTLEGGAGADILLGGSGDDTYKVDFNDGDLIFDDGGTDTVEFSSGASVYVIKISQDPDDPGSLYLRNGYGAQLQIVGGFSNSIEFFKVDGETYSYAEFMSVIDSDPLNLIGGDGDDVIQGARDNDRLDGQDGNDQIYGIDGDDLLSGGDGSDQLWGGEGRDNLRGGEGGDNLQGGAGDDSLNGDQGNDSLNGGAGNDSLSGGAGDDSYTFNLGDGLDVIIEGGESEGLDTLNFGPGILSTDISVVSDGDNLIFQISGTDKVQVSGFFSDSSARIEEVRFAADGAVWNAAAILAQIKTLSGTNADESITGTNLGESIFGLGGNDSLYALQGDDILDGGSGIDSMQGGLGNDLYVVDNQQDVIVEGLDEGIDTVKSSVNYSMHDNVENLILTGSENLLAMGNDLSNVIYGNEGNNYFFHSLGWDTIYGGRGDDTYEEGEGGLVVVEYAGEGTDVIAVLRSTSYYLPENVEIMDARFAWRSILGPGEFSGNDLDNVIVTRIGSTAWYWTLEPEDFFGDRVDGGLGADTYYESNSSYTNFVVDNVGDRVYVYMADAAFTWDTVESYIDYTIIPGIDQITLIGDAAVSAYGDAGNNKLSGEQNSAANLLAGGAGDDLYLVGRGDRVLENAGEGDADRVRIFATTNGAAFASDYANVEIIELDDEAGISSLFGDDRNNILVSNGGITGGSYLYGGNGNDELRGKIDIDFLDGGAGDDLMSGGGGGDVYTVDSVGDRVVEGQSFYDAISQRYVDGGYDRVFSSVSFQLGDWVESLTLTGSNATTATGNNADNSLDGTQNSAANTLIGLGGNDHYYAGQNDIIVEAADGGIDTLHSEFTVNVLAENVENVRLEGYTDANATGNAGDNVLSGNSLNNLLVGGLGNDTLDGGYGGEDTLDGGLGNDVYLAGNNSDGAVNLISSADHTAGKVDVLRFSLNSTDVAFYRVGNDLEFENIYNGGMTRVVGYYDNANGTRIERVEFADGVVFTATDFSVHDVPGTAGNDSLVGGAGYDNISGLNGNDSLYGGQGNDSLSGGAGDDLLDGGAGFDRLAGGTGDDTYLIDDRYNRIQENAGEGIDTVKSSIEEYYLDLNVENLVLLQSAISGYGNELANRITGNDQENELMGYEGDDYLDGGAGVDTMYGGSGNDTYVVEKGNDRTYEDEDNGIDTVLSSANFTLPDWVENLTITGTQKRTGTGNELNNHLIGNTNTDNLKGEDGSDWLEGLAGNDTLDGGDGNDTIDGGSGGDSMLGGSGDDFFVVGQVEDIVKENASKGTDTVQSSIEYTLGNNLENLILTGSGLINGTGNTLDNQISGNAAANLLSAKDGNDTLTGGAGKDTLQGGSGNDVYRFNAGDGEDTIIDSSGIDRIEFGANVLPANVTVTRDTRNLYLTLAASGDQITIQDFFFNAAAEIEEVRFGSVVWDRATLIGMIQSNHLPVLAIPIATQLYTEGKAFSFALPAGTFTDADPDNTLTLSATLTNNDPLPAWLVFNPLTGIFSGTPPSDAAGLVNVRVTATDNFGGNASGDFVVDVANYIAGNASANNMIGTANRDVMEGLDNKDTLDGGANADLMIGGTNDDLYKVDNLGDVVQELLNEGTDRVESSVTFTLSANVEHLTLTGNNAINGTGNALNNTLTGNSGANVLRAAAGDDLYIVGQGDSVIENLSEGFDRVESEVNFTLGDNIEDLTLTGTAVSGTGNALDNTLTGNAVGNRLDGQAGNDKLDGKAGDDTMRGGVGNDLYIVDSLLDQVIENASEGTDTVESTVSFTLGNNVENLSLKGSALINASGNSLDNVLNGNEAANTLNGGAGADTMSGDAGDDVYVVDNVGDVVQESSGKGSDLVQSAVSYTLGANVEKLTLTGSVALTADGNTLDNVLVGNALNNRLSGKSGADTMAGGLGDDVYDVSESGDVVQENIGEGIDLVESKLLSYTLSANLENLTLIGADTVNGSGTGNELNNQLTGNNGNNTLRGESGNDTLIGAGGNDTMIGGAGDDVYVLNGTDLVQENSNEGTDTIQVGASYTLLTNFEKLALTGTGNYSATGNSVGNRLSGNSGDNILDGKAGADTMEGGAGNDKYIVDDINDLILENAGEGTDSVESTVTHSLSANVEKLTLMGSAAISATGNELNNELIGNSGNNTLSGGAGNDVLNGAGGDDSMLGGSGDDSYTIDTAGDRVTENAGEGFDLVQSGLSFSLGNNVEALILTGTADMNGTGNSLANLLRGNAKVNTLSGDAGNDLLEGGAGNDSLNGGTGTGYLNGGTGKDSLVGGIGNEIYIGGTGDETITTDLGADIIAFNAGDGKDKISASTGADNTISLGGGIGYEELFFLKSGNDLILKTNGAADTTESITLTGWYSGTTNKSVINLQVVAEAMAGFDQNGSNPLKDDKIEQFNFIGLVNAFDAARAANGSLTDWALTNALTSFYLSGSDTGAIGGDLAYQYGMNGSLSNVGVTGAQNVINAGTFGSSAQTFQDQNALQQGVVRLS